MSKNLETVRRYYKAGEASDWSAAGRCIGRGYVWIDHATGVVARSADELQAALADDEPWANMRLDIEEAFEAEGGTLIVRAIRSGTLRGAWRSMDATGQEVTYPYCAIFRFCADGLIVHEEAYYDMSSVRRQLGYGSETESG
jgi:predicted ester cyclase